ncbi:MAG: CAP domain-containing protein [Bacillota bacterium]
MRITRRTALLGTVVVLLFFGFLILAPLNALAADWPGLLAADNIGYKLVYKFSLIPKNEGQSNYSTYTYRLVSYNPAKTYYYYPATKIIRIYYTDRSPVIIREPGPQPKPQPQPAPAPRPEPVKELTADEQRMVELVNQERARYGLPALKVNPELVKVARLKAQDMVANNYFGHTSPTYGSPFAMMKQFGITYRTAGENLAGAPAVEIAHRNLMNSPGHRANILNSSFTQVGIGVVEGSPYGKIFVQMFIG